MRSHEKLNQVVLHVCFVWHISISGVSIILHRFFKNRHNSIKLCWNKSKKMPRLNNNEQNKAIVMLNAGMSATVALRHFGCTVKTIQLLQKWFRVTGNFDDHPQSGRPQVTTAADDRYIVLQHLRNSHPTAAATVTVWFSSTNCQKLIETKCSTYSCVMTYFGEILTQRHRTARQDWCHRHLHLRRADWDLMLFSYECRFNLCHNDRCERIYCHWGEHFADACFIELDRFGGGSVFVWVG